MTSLGDRLDLFGREVLLQLVLLEQLDEVVAHLDPSRRAALFGELQELGVQAWMTGADAAAFVEIEGKADMLEISPGQIGKRGS